MIVFNKMDKLFRVHPSVKLQRQLLFDHCAVYYEAKS